MAPGLIAPGVVALLALLAGTSRAEDARWNEREVAVRKALRSADPAVRAGAFQPIRGTDDPRAVDLLLEGVTAVWGEQEKIRKAQAEAEKAYEGTLTDQERNRRTFQSSPQSQKDVQRYNDAERKIAKTIETSLARLRDLENDFLRSRALLDGASQVMGEVLAKVSTEALLPSLAKVEGAWLGSRKPEDALLYVDTVAALDRPWVGERLREAARDTARPQGVRGAALVALAGRKDDATHAIAVPILAAPPEEFLLVAAAIEALRVAHSPASIPPLIDFLKREDIKRLREDARGALMSLTGQEHGPYHDPWNRWWEEAGGAFAMPPAPVARRRGQEKGGVTFYGIQSFSDRILFVLDVSGSMDQPSKAGEGGPEGPPRIDIARKELVGAVQMMNEGERFDVILFNHSVMPWQPRMMEVSEATKKQGLRWATEQPPVGGTNIHDALEAAFQMAFRSTGRPDVDTVMFMTDGRPTAGKIQDPKAILDRVREWNRIANLTLHCVGIGEHDEAFLSELARIGNGEYVKR